jgi:hypothetical protein
VASGGGAGGRVLIPVEMSQQQQPQQHDPHDVELHGAAAYYATAGATIPQGSTMHQPHPSPPDMPGPAASPLLPTSSILNRHIAK